VVALFLQDRGICVFFPASGDDKGHKCQCTAGERERKTEQFSRKPSGFLFFWFLHHFHFTEFCRTCYFEFLNYVLTKNLEIESSCFRNFYLFIFNFLKISNLNDRLLVNR
jgi:hypothetical protein